MWVLAAKVAGAGAAYWLAATISRAHGAAAYGAFELALTLAGIAAMIGRLGLDGAWVRFLPEALASGGLRGQAAQKSFALVFFASLVLAGLLSGFCASIASAFDSPGLEDGLRWAWVAVPSLSLLGLAAEMLRGGDRLLAYAWLQRGTLLLGVLLVFLALPDGAIVPFALFSAVALLAALVALGLALPMLRSQEQPGDGGLDLPLRQVLRTAAPMLLTAATFELMSWADTLLCGVYLGEADVARYRVAFRLAALLTLGQTAINAALAPRIARAFASGGDATPMLAQAARWNWTIALSGSAFLLSAGGWVLPWFGPEYADVDTSLTLRILLVGAAFNAISGPVLTLMNMTNAERQARNIVLVAAGLNIALNIAMIPQLGMAGAAWATTFSTVLWNAMALVWVRRHRGVWSPFPTFKPTRK